MDFSEEITNHPYVIELKKTYEKRILELEKAVEALRCNNLEQASQVKYFINLINGAKSERRVYSDKQEMPAEQLKLLELPEIEVIKLPQKQIVPAKTSSKVIPINNASQSGLRYSKEVKVVEVQVDNPVTLGLEPSQYTVIAEKVAEKLCQAKRTYYIKRYKQQVIKLKETGEIRQDAAPEKVIQSVQADLSLLVGMAVDKFQYHLPLYRQHQRMLTQGITVSRASLTYWIHDFIDLFKPVYEALKSSILTGEIVSIDETPHKAGRRNNTGKMDQCYYWFLYGQYNEVYIHQNTSRGKDVVKKLLFNEFKGTLLSDGYGVYDSIAKELGLQHANCMAHARRKFIEAESQEPLSAKHAVNLIRLIYEKEAVSPKDDPAKLLNYRLKDIKPIVDSLFDWLELESMRLQGLPNTRYSQAVHYTLSRKASLSVFLSNPVVPLDNNHTERAIRPLVLGRKNYLFCWSELGAEKVAIIQSIILTCNLHGIDVYDYLFDVANRISTHPNSRISDLLPRNWKTLFADTFTINSVAA